MISQSNVEFVTMPPEKAAKFITPKIEKINNEVKSITLTIPLLSSKNGYLIIHFPEEPVKLLLDQAKALPNNQQTLFVQDWLVKNQTAALNKYLHNPSIHSFRCDTTSINFKPSEVTLVRTNEGTYQIDLATPKSTDKFAKIKITLPLVVNFNKKEVGTFSFRINLKLVHLTNRNLTKTTACITSAVRSKITLWAERYHINTGSKQFKLALQDALSHINLREQVRKIKNKNKNLIHYLDSH